MAKILECTKVEPSSGCKHVVQSETVEEVLQKADELLPTLDTYLMFALFSAEHLTPGIYFWLSTSFKIIKSFKLEERFT